MINEYGHSPRAHTHTDTYERMEIRSISRYFAVSSCCALLSAEPCGRKCGAFMHSCTHSVTHLFIKCKCTLTNTCKYMYTSTNMLLFTHTYAQIGNWKLHGFKVREGDILQLIYWTLILEYVSTRELGYYQNVLRTISFKIWKYEGWCAGACMRILLRSALINIIIIPF